MVKSYSKILNEGFNSYFKKLEESVQTIYDEYRNMTKEPIIEFPNGDYFYVVVDPETNSIYAGSATNTGVFREYEIDIDEDGTLDSNLEALYDYMIEENPELTYDAEDIENTNKYYDELISESLDESTEKFIITKVGNNTYALAQGNPPVVNSRKTIEASSPEEAKKILMNYGYSEDELIVESLNEEYEEVDISDYKYVGNVDGFYIYRKIVRNGDKVKGIWAAQDQNEKNPPFAITYNQALGYEPITKYESNAKKLGRELGKILLPKIGSKNESYNLKRNRNTKSLKESLLNEAPNISIPKDSLNDPSSISLRGIAKDAVDKENQEKAEKEEAERRAQLAEKAKDLLAEIKADTESEDTINAIFHACVPSSGKSDNLAGELARAMERISYRDYNDGDVFYDGYGLETCGEAAAFIMTHVPEFSEAFLSIAERALMDDSYTDAINNIREELGKYILNNTHLLAEQTGDMFEDYDEGLLAEIRDSVPLETYDVDISGDYIEQLMEIGAISYDDIEEWIEDILRECVEYGSDAYVNRWAQDAFEIRDLTPSEYKIIEDEFDDTFYRWVEEAYKENEDEIDEYFYGGEEDLDESHKRKNNKRLSESMKDANKAERELYNFLDKWIKKYSEFLDMETLSDIYYSAIDTEF